MGGDKTGVQSGIYTPDRTEIAKRLEKNKKRWFKKGERAKGKRGRGGKTEREV